MEKQPEELLRFILSKILDDKAELKINSIVDERGLLFEIKVKEDQMGRLIGKGGKTIQSIRTILGVLGTKIDQKIFLKILEPIENNGK